MTLEEYVEKTYNLKKNEYTLARTGKTSVCSCGKRSDILKLHYTSGQDYISKEFGREWANCHCSCGAEWGKHTEFIPTYNTKNWCMAHRGKFENTRENYEDNGNFCPECSRRHRINSEKAIRERTYPQEGLAVPPKGMLHFQ